MGSGDPVFCSPGTAGMTKRYSYFLINLTAPKTDLHASY